MAGKRHRNSRQAEKPPFHRSGHGAGVNHVVTEVRAVVDPRDDQIRLVVEKARQRQVHAIRRLSGICTVRELLAAERLRSGATTTTSATLASASVSTLIPVAR